MSKIQELRKAKGYSQGQLATKVGISVQAVRSYEQGFRNINKAELSTLLKICNGMECKIEDILDDAETLKEWEKYQNRG